MARIEILVPHDPKKPTKIDVSGVKGAKCESLTAGIEAALGKVASRETKDEYHQTQSQDLQQLQ